LRVRVSSTKKKNKRVSSSLLHPLGENGAAPRSCRKDETAQNALNDKCTTGFAVLKKDIVTAEKNMKAICADPTPEHEQSCALMGQFIQTDICIYVLSLALNTHTVA
jgi:hypothetical protein